MSTRSHIHLLTALRRTLRSVGGVALFLCTVPTTIAWADSLTSAQELAHIRELAESGAEPQKGQRDQLLSHARATWRWGGVTGEFVTTERDGEKRCHPASRPSQIEYLKEGAPDAYAKVLGYHLSGEEPLIDEARARVLDLVDTSGFHGLWGSDFSGGNQCVLDLALSIPVWIESASLLEGTPVWSDMDRRAFGEWLAREAYPKVAWASRARRNNWGAAGSLAAGLIADYVDGWVPELTEYAPVRTLTPSEARAEHRSRQLDRIATTWRGDTRCGPVGIQGHGGIPDELRRGATGCEGTYLASDSDPSYTYQTMHVELLVFHAEALRRRGDPSLFDALAPNGAPALLQSILFVVDNPSPEGRSWPWRTRTGTLLVAQRYYGDPRLAEAARAGTTFRGGRTLPYAGLSPGPVGKPGVPRMLLSSEDLSRP